MNNWPTESRQARGLGAAWDKVRLIVLRRDNGLCMCDRCQGGKLRATIATEVHHIVSRAEAKRRGWTQAQTDAMSNLASVNSDCHKRLDAAAQGRAYRPKTRIGLDGFPARSLD